MMVPALAAAPAAGRARRSHRHHDRRLWPHRHPHRRRSGVAGPHDQRHPGDPVPPAGDDRGRPARRRGQRIYRRGAARSRRPGVAVCADAEGQGQLDGRRATGCSSICCPKAGPASRPACRARWSRSWPRRANEAERAGAAEDRGGGAAEEDSVGAGARRGAADLHALHFRTAGADRRHRRARQGQADAWRSARRCGSICRTPSSPATRPWPRSMPAAAATAPRSSSSSRKAADIRTFREDSNYVVDVSPIDAKAELKPEAKPDRKPAGPLADVSAPETVPAKTGAKPKPPAVGADLDAARRRHAQGRRRRRRRRRR